MIYGKADWDILNERQKYLESLYEKEFEAFAYWPTKLGDGRTVFWQTYQYTYRISRNMSMYYNADKTLWFDRILKRKYLN